MLDPLTWPARFSAAHGRQPRVLHLGNVANYAYVTAKLMRQAGVSCDVADPDFYHIMASPEWYEADWEGGYGDEFLPRWSQLDLKDYQRPRWFAQGPAELVFRYLATRHVENHARQSAEWRALEFSRRLTTGDLNQFELWLTRVRWKPFRLMGRGLAALISPSLLQVGRGDPALEAKSTPASPADDLDLPILAEIRRRASFYRAALAHYDIVQGYTTLAYFPAALGMRNFIAYELGTLRGLPFEDSPAGRLTAWVYRTAPEIFVTNSDCMAAARRLGIEDFRLNPVLHGFDLEEAKAFLSNWGPPQVDSHRPLVLAPARHHWSEGNASWLKGNDVFLRGAALARDRGLEFRVRLFDWGSEVHLSRQLIENLGLQGCIEWGPPLPRRKLWPLYMEAAAVADQFSAGSLGGVALESLALGRRLITSVKEDATAAHFGSLPPVFNASSPQAVAEALSVCLADPTDTARRGAMGIAWMGREHSGERQLRQQFSVYERLLASLGPN